jgi:hypothetical protein
LHKDQTKGQKFGDLRHTAGTRLADSGSRCFYNRGDLGTRLVADDKALYARNGST